MSSSECNYDGGVCLFGPNLGGFGCGAVGQCETMDLYEAGCAIEQETACGCDGGVVLLCDTYAPERTTGPCAGSTGDASDDGG
jgi:hypothetical protein